MSHRTRFNRRIKKLNRRKTRRIKNQPGRWARIIMFFSKLFDSIGEFLIKERTEYFESPSFTGGSDDDEIIVLRTQCKSTPEVKICRRNENRGRHWDRKRQR